MNNTAKGQKTMSSSKKNSITSIAYKEKVPEHEKRKNIFVILGLIMMITLSLSIIIPTICISWQTKSIENLVRWSDMVIGYIFGTLAYFLGNIISNDSFSKSTE